MRTLIATLFAAVLPIAANAVPVTPSSLEETFETLFPGGTLTTEHESGGIYEIELDFTGFEYTDGFDFSAAGDAIDDLAMRFPGTFPDDYKSVAAGLAERLMMDSDFSLILTVDVLSKKALSYTIVEASTPVGTVPVPAAGLLLGSAILGAGALTVGRRRHKAS